jgi:hypothetical protein
MVRGAFMNVVPDRIEIPLGFNHSSISLELGSIYAVLRDYVWDPGHGEFEVLAVMPEAIDTPNHRIYLYCIGFDPDIFNIRVNNFINDTLVLSYHSPDDGETLLVEMNKDEMCWAIENMPRRGVNVISIGPFSIDIFDIHIEARFENLPYAKIFQLNRRLKDLRKWPRKALEVWAGTHLRISGEQYSTAVEMDQKYKFVQYAQ